MRFSFLLFLLFLFGNTIASPSDSSAEGKMKHGKKSGAWTYYDSTKHIVKVEKYRKGKLVQTYIFNSDGHVIERINRKGYVTKLRACGC